ncbi:uncharacterized protein K444DRAFT_625384 [Hyaloscypha bicolor E]|uniref:Uncharacterized protein n=1 Tax=Hyaloscypha bicolor E TaxID=1095630 RepID=A0A2J6TNZ4_9HELO|nr:uncharacterized protein K444DRAFT_625384 [Hyaloscypha bicolor E]PMD64734.1 hypothetical protein K444DRAFT_625384 [Hyaloscypha bicolor E]
MPARSNTSSFEGSMTSGSGSSIGPQTQVSDTLGRYLNAATNISGRIARGEFQSKKEHEERARRAIAEFNRVVKRDSYSKSTLMGEARPSGTAHGAKRSEIRSSENTFIPSLPPPPPPPPPPELVSTRPA